LKKRSGGEGKTGRTRKEKGSLRPGKPNEKKKLNNSPANKERDNILAGKKWPPRQKTQNRRLSGRAGKDDSYLAKPLLLGKERERRYNTSPGAFTPTLDV